LYGDDSSSKEATSPAVAKNILKGACSPIASRALVETARRLKRLADQVESSNTITGKKEA
jgi:hypothetical protein